MKGLFGKYIVRKRSDNSIVTNCFVLRPDRDDAAIAAMLAYADATSDEQLAQELRKWAEFEQRVKSHITNADHIRAMSDMELADFMAVRNCPPRQKQCQTSCCNCWREWIQQPYKEDKE